MGDFRIEIIATGGHGCQREKKDGETVTGCQYMYCPDCIAREFVQYLKDKGMNPRVALFTHWPGEENSVQDDMLTCIRKGSFS